MAMNVGSSNSSGEPEPMMDVNTTPLIDVMLVLLVMLIITIPIQLHSVNLEMPSTAAPPPPVEPKVVRIDITAAGKLLGNGQAVTGAEPLETRLQAAAALAEP